MARTNACAVGTEGKIYLFGGRAHRPLEDGLAAAMNSDGDSQAALYSNVMGPMGEGSECGDLWVLDLASQEWTPLHMPSATRLDAAQHLPSEREEPEPRHSAVMWLWGGSLFLFGGAAQITDLDSTFGDLWRFDLESKHWSTIPLRGALLGHFHRSPINGLGFAVTFFMIALGSFSPTAVVQCTTVCWADHFAKSSLLDRQCIIMTDCRRCTVTALSTASN
jgi:hypothetical protein